MQVDRISVLGRQVNKKFLRNQTPERMAQLIKEGLGLAPKGKTISDATDTIYLYAGNGNVMREGGLSSIARALQEAVLDSPDLAKSEFRTPSAIKECSRNHFFSNI